MKISILLAEDHNMVRQAIKGSLEHDGRFEVVGESESGEYAVLLAARLHPSIVLMDINLVGMNGIEATRQIHDRAPDTRVLCISGNRTMSCVKGMMQSGACGYITKNCGREEMFRAIMEVYAGNKYYCEEVKDLIVDFSMKTGKTDSISNLSKREMEIGWLIKEGKTSKEISEVLGIARKTVEVHRYNMLKKLKLGNSAALVNYFHNNSINA